MKAKELTRQILVSIITNLITSSILFLLGFFLNFILGLNIATPYLIGGVLLISAITTLYIFLKTYEGILDRLNRISFLAEDSATKSFDLFINIVKKFIINSGVSDSEGFEKTVLPLMQKIIDQRKQPMQIIAVDSQKILAKYKQYGGQTSVPEQVLYYLDFMAAYKRMAMPRIIRQANLYMESFGANDITDYVVIYGHSTVVVNAVISGYKTNPFPIVVVEDLQYHKQSLGEHKIVCKSLDNADVSYALIKFGDIQKLFDSSVTNLPSKSGEDLPLLRRRRIHAFIGCERIDTLGNTLVPSESKGIPSESAQFLQEVEVYSQEKGSERDTPARIVVLAESYKIRGFDRVLDVKTHVPLKGHLIQRILYILGISDSPPLYPVSLFNIKASNIYVHINELGIFPNVGGKFDLRYCENVFETETSLLGFFSKPLLLKYQLFDEIKAVLFDLNGVVVNDEELHFKAFANVLEEFKVIFTVDDYETFCLGKSDEVGFAEIKQKYEIDQSIDLLVHKKHDAYFTLVGTSDIELQPGCMRLLRELKNRGYKIGLVTASNRKEVKTLLVILKIEHYFDIVITNDDVSESKPSPQGYLIASEKLMIPSSRCLVVEDSLINIKAVSQEGMKTICVSRKERQRDVAHFTVSSLEELLVS